jgi:hypothetical protein
LRDASEHRALEGQQKADAHVNRVFSNHFDYISNHFGLAGMM